MGTTTPSKIGQVPLEQFRFLEALAWQDVHQACCGVKGALGSQREAAKQHLAEVLERLWQLNLADARGSILSAVQDEFCNSAHPLVGRALSTASR